MSRRGLTGTEAGQRSGAQAIERALAVLACFDRSPDLGVSEIGRRTDLSVSTCHRVLRALCRGGLVAQDEATGRYALGVGAAMMGALALDRLGFSAALPKLQRLAAELGEAISLGVRVRTESLIVLQVDSPLPDGVEAVAGVRSPVHACALGKVLVAFDLERAAPPGELIGLTPRTITDPVALERELVRIRKRGWAANDEELVVGVRSVGVPVFDRFGRVNAAIGVAAPAARLPRREFARAAAAVSATAEQLQGVLPRTVAAV